MYAGAADPTQAFAAVGRGGPGESGMTWSLPPQPDPTQAIPVQGPPTSAPGPATPGFPTQALPTQALPVQGAPDFPAEPDPYASLFRPPAGAPAHPNATQVMAPVAAPAPGGTAYDQPGYDQPIDYQAGGGGPYSEPYDGPYTDDYDGEPAAPPRSSRAAIIGIGVAAGAILVIVISLITIGGGTPTPAATPGSSATEVVTPNSTAASSPATSHAPATSASTPSSTPPSTVAHPPGTLGLGDTGNDVKWLQGRLKQLHLYNGEISGTFDAATQAAVVAFQNRTHPADPSGIVGRSTKTALIAAGSKPTLSILPGGGGDHHGKGGVNPEDVKRLQRALSSALNQNIKATGQFDVETFGAVVQYQSSIGLGPDGVAGDKVWSALQQGKIAG